MSELTDRMWPQIDRSGECWLWLASRTAAGYGQIATGRNRNMMYVHRLMWMLCYGDPGALYVLHRCDVRACCRPEHLFLGTQADNIRDAVQKGRLDMSGLQRRGKWTHCKQGHEFTEENTYRYPDGTRECRICMKERSRRSGAAYRLRKKQQGRSDVS